MPSGDSVISSRTVQRLLCLQIVTMRSEQLERLQIVEVILNYPRSSHAPPTDDPAREEIDYQATHSPDTAEKADRVARIRAAMPTSGGSRSRDFMFAIGRMPGWIANFKEILDDSHKRICRPRQIYIGPAAAHYVPIDERR